MGSPRNLWSILKGTTENWLDDQASSISAALAFYCAFSLAPLLSVLMLLIGASTVFAALQRSLQQIWGGHEAQPRSWRAFVRARLLSIALGTGLVALMYRYLPARRLAWRHVLIGAMVTALLFHAGRWAIGFYLGHATQPTAFGAAASFAALLLWLYYSAQIFLFGAEFTACLGRSRKPAPLAAPITSA
jgi:uncharacterized BrkB/YihY/UPF0761 family membrane protein